MSPNVIRNELTLKFGRAIARYPDLVIRKPVDNAFYNSFKNSENEKTENSALIFAGDYAYVVDISKGYNCHGQGELIRINGFSQHKTKSSTQYLNYLSLFKQLNLVQSKYLIKQYDSKTFVNYSTNIDIVNYSTNIDIVNYSTNIDIVNDFVSDLLCDDQLLFWLPNRINEWINNGIYTYKHKFNYLFNIDTINKTLKTKIFVNRGFIMMDIYIQNNGPFVYNIRGMEINGGRTQYVTLCRVDGAHGFYHIHFAKPANGTTLLPSYNISNIEIRVSQSKVKHIERKIRRLNERQAGIKIINFK